MAHEEKNPFDLEGRTEGPPKNHPHHVWTPEEQEEKLRGYIEIPPEFWEHIRTGTHVRYVSKTEGFRPGGFVLRNPFDKKAQGEATEKRCMILQNGFNDKARGYASWPVAYESTAKVYVKPDATTLVVFRNLETLETAIRGLNGNIKKLAEYAQKLERRVAQLEGSK